jgi:protein-tyrosine phosphatase
MNMIPDPTAIEITLDPRVMRTSGVAIHGDTPFDCPVISHISDNLWQGGCIGGIALPEEIVHVVSLYPWEAYVGHDGVRSLMQVRMYDSEGQGFDQVEAIARWVNTCREDGPTLVHCQAGLNRSSLVAARALMLIGWSAEKAIATIREKRSPACLCNPAFEAYLLGLDNVVFGV